MDFCRLLSQFICKQRERESTPAFILLAEALLEISKPGVLSAIKSSLCRAYRADLSASEFRVPERAQQHVHRHRQVGVYARGVRCIGGSDNICNHPRARGYIICGAQRKRERW